MIIAGYQSSSMSGATPITLVTALTHIMLGDERIATFQSQTDDTPKTSDDDKLIFHLSDHLNSSSLDLSSTGIVLQAVDYLPFGKSNTYEITSKRVKGKKGGYTNKYQFANKQLDEESDLQYFEKRYYDNRIGRFTTEDPVYWEVGKTKRPDQYFTDPQQWNSYSYVRNNPINMVDPTGELIDKSKTYTDTRPNGGGKSYYQSTNLTLHDTDQHYTSNNGTDIRVSFNEIDTSFITPESFSPVKNVIDAGVEGEYVFSDLSTSATMTPGKDYNVFGDLSFKAEGKLIISKEGRWSFQGTIKAFDDLYDFKISNKDVVTPSRWLRNIGTFAKRQYLGNGTDFNIQITGEKPLTGIGYGTAAPQTSQGSTSPTSSLQNKPTGRANLSRGPLLN